MTRDEISAKKQFLMDIALMEARGVPLSTSDVDPNKIINAIRNRYYIGIYYEEDSDEVMNGYRLVEPYVFGYGYNFNGIAKYPDRGYLRGFVIMKHDPIYKQKFKKGYKSVSKSKRLPYWRLFRLDRIKRLWIIRKKIQRYREFYNENDQHIAQIVIAADKSWFKGVQPIKK